MSEQMARRRQERAERQAGLLRASRRGGAVETEAVGARLQALHAARRAHRTANGVGAAVQEVQYRAGRTPPRSRTPYAPLSTNKPESAVQTGPNAGAGSGSQSPYVSRQQARRERLAKLGLSRGLQAAQARPAPPVGNEMSGQVADSVPQGHLDAIARLTPSLPYGTGHPEEDEVSKIAALEAQLAALQAEKAAAAWANPVDPTTYNLALVGSG